MDLLQNDLIHFFLFLLYMGVYLPLIFYYIGIQLINNVVVVSGLQQSESIYMFPFFFKIFSQSSHHITLNRVSYAIQEVLVGHLF